MIGKVLLLFIFVVGISGCDKEEVIPTYTVSLYNNGELIEVIENIEENTLIELPELEEEGMLFVGYTSEDYIYYDEYTVTRDITLYASFEIVTDVFEYTEFEQEPNKVGITGYTGNATHLKIPQMINGKLVTSIMGYAFEESNLVEVIIPVDAYVNSFAFYNSIELKEVSFYGNYLLTVLDMISDLAYDDIMAEYTETCIIIEGSVEEGTWKFSDGCPILEIVSINDSIWIDGIEYFYYNAIVDSNYFQLSAHMTFGNFAFKGATSLEVVQIPEATSFFFADSFEGCISLRNFIVGEESEFFAVLEGVLYNKNLTRLIYYPPGKEGTSYTLLDSLQTINMYAFMNNMFLETIIISESFNIEFVVQGLSNLKEIVVDENNEHYYTIDGVLFNDAELVKYPAAKSGDSYTVPEGILSIGPYSFAYNKYLEMTDLGNELTNIGMGAFHGAEMLSELNIPSSVMYIRMYALTNSSIDTIIVNRSLLIDGSITFLTVSFGPVDEEDFKIYVSNDSIDEYLTSIFWKNYSDDIYPITEYSSE